MSDQDIKVQTFNDLRLVEEQLEKIPLRKVARIALNSLRRQDNDIEVYEFVFGKVVHCFDPDEFETEISVVLLPELLKHLDKIATELKDIALTCFVIDNLQSLLAIANLLLNFAEYVFQVSETHQLYRTITIFLEYLVRSYEIVHRRKRTVSSEAMGQDVVQQIFVVCQKMQLIVTHMLTPSSKASPYFQHVDVGEQFLCLKDVICTLCKIGCLTVGIDNIRCSEAWKAVGKLSSVHETKIKASDTRWIHPLIFESNQEIEVAFKSMLESRELTKNDMVKLKLINLILRVMIKFLQLINVDEYDEYQCILTTTIVIESALLSINIGKEFIEAIRQHLLVGYMTVIELTFRSSQCLTALTSLKHHTYNEMASFYNIIILVISKLVLESRHSNVIEIYTAKCSLLITCVDYLRSSHSVFNQHVHLYRQLLIHLSAFVLLCSKQPTKTVKKLLEQTLVKMILQDDYWTGTMGLDIWSVYLRYHPVELLWKHFKFWKVVNDRFSNFTSQTRAVFVRRLIRNMFTFMPKSMQQEVLIKYSVTDPRNHKLWITIGLKSAKEHLTDSVKQSILRLFKENISNVLEQPTKENMYGIINMLHLVCSCDDRLILQNAESEINPIYKYLKHVTKHNPKLDTFTYTLLKFVRHLSAHGQCSNIAQQVCSESFSGEISLHSANTKKKYLELIKLMPDGCERVLKILAKDRNMLIRLSTLHALTTLPHLKIHEKICSDFILAELQRIRSEGKQNTARMQQYMKCSVQTALQHRCTDKVDAMQITQHISDRIDELFPDDDEDFGIPTTKRPKMDCSENVSTIEEKQNDSRTHATMAITELNNQVEVLKQLRDKNLLSEEQLCEIRRIIATIKDI